MFKTGIYQRDRLTLKAITGFLGRRKFIAITLYPHVASSDLPERDRLLEHILCRFPAANGTYKRTQSHRFDEFDAHVIRLLRERLEPNTQYKVHDMAVSDGRTAVDFFQKIDAIDHLQFDFLATDAFTNLTAISAPPNALTIVIDSKSQKLLQIIRPPFVFNLEKHESTLLYLFNRLVREVLLLTGVRTLLACFKAQAPEVVTTPIRMLSPECLQLLEKEPRFHFDQHSILEPSTGAFHLVRAMNVLNHNYFSQKDLYLAAANIHASLLPGGLFVTGSNYDAGTTVNGGVYERTAIGFKLLWSSGSGSQVDEILANFGSKVIDHIGVVF